MARRNANGEGTIYQRKDGRWEASVYVITTSGLKKRVRVYGATRAEAHAKLTDLKAKSEQGIPTPDKNWKLGDYLDYWLEEVVKPGKKPKTYEQYELVVRRNLKPDLGGKYLHKLTVREAQAFINHQKTQEYSTRRVQMIRNTLSSALTRAMKDELVTRNVARLVEVKAPESELEREEINPWSFDEVKRFLAAARDHRLYPAFLLTLLYGMRRGEVLGLAWSDVDFAGGTFAVRQQLQRVGREVVLTSLKTKASRRTLPLLSDIVSALERLRLEQSGVEEDLVFRTSVGTPIEPRNFVRTFWQLCRQADVRVIKLHHLRHSQATMLEHLGVPAKTAQAILGHSSVAVTQGIYQHGGMNLKREALELLQNALHQTKTTPDDVPEWLMDAFDGSGCRQLSRQSQLLKTLSLKSYLEGPVGLEPTTPCLKDRAAFTLTKRMAEVEQGYRVRRRQMLLGVVAVNLAVKVSEPNNEESVT